MGHKHSVYDIDAHFTINPITKVIEINKSIIFLTLGKWCFLY